MDMIVTRVCTCVRERERKGGYVCLCVRKHEHVCVYV